MVAKFTSLPIALLLAFVYGLNTSTDIVVFNATLQDVIPDRVRRRVFPLLDITWNEMRLASPAD